MSAPQAEAAVTAVNFGLASQYGTSTNFRYVGMYPVAGGASIGGTVMNVSSGGAYIGYASNRGYAYNNGSDFSFGGIGSGTISFFPNGTVIGNGANGIKGYGFFYRQDIAKLSLGTDVNSQNIGFETMQGNFGWANVSWNNSGKVLTINAAYVESVPNQPITIDTSLISGAPEPGRALLALAGLGAVALRRRRRA